MAHKIISIVSDNQSVYIESRREYFNRSTTTHTFSFLTLIQFILIMVWSLYQNPTVAGFFLGLVWFILFEIIAWLSIIPFAGAYLQYRYMHWVISYLHIASSPVSSIIFLSYFIPGIIVTIITSFLALAFIVGIFFD